MQVASLTGFNANNSHFPQVDGSGTARIEFSLADALKGLL